MSTKKDKFSWSAGDTTMTVNGKQGKFVNGKFVPAEGKKPTNSTKKKG